jgi:RNA polymerase sigma-70 factor (ECF subfamily)
MARDDSQSVVPEIYELFSTGTASGMSDAQLLPRFAVRGDGSESAIAVLVARHGSMVLGVCHRI